MSKKNEVIMGKYEGSKIIVNSYNGKGIVIKNNTVGNDIYLNKSSIDNYQLVSSDSTKSALSAMLRAGTGALILGPVGLAAGLSAKNKLSYTYLIKYKDGKNSIIQLDKTLNEVFLREMF